MTDPAALVRTLTERGATLATAESFTGGLVAGAVTSVSGSSEVFLGSVVAYATRLKISLLGVPAELVDEHGVVSAACAEGMATGVRRVVGATYALATTGVAGPTTQEGKAPGTAFIALAGPDGTRVEALMLSGDREEVRRQGVAAALTLLADSL